MSEVITWQPQKIDNIIHNPGCGIMYLQRGRNKIRYDEVPADAWFLQEKLTDKISFTLAWSVIEPEEGKFVWDHPDWEGCINSWIDAGFKVALQIRGMDTYGTLYNDGVPQWVFDAGAKYIDEDLAIYRNTKSLNFIADNATAPVRLPVYWDEIYLEKVRHFVDAMGARYNGRPEVELISIGHMGRWGEMHIAGHSPLQPWFDVGFSRETFIQAHKRIIDIYCDAFPDTPLLQETGSPAYSESTERDYLTMEDVPEIFDYVMEKGIMLKNNGIGKAWRPSRNQYLDDSVPSLFDRYAPYIPVATENLVLKEGLELALEHSISYWNRGGESQGLGILHVDQSCPVEDKKIYSHFAYFPDEFNKMNLDDEKELWRLMAAKCGYRLEIEYLTIYDDKICIHWNNSGSAKCYLLLTLKLDFYDNEDLIKSYEMPCRAQGVETLILKEKPEGDYRIELTVKSSKGIIQLGNEGKTKSRIYIINE